MSATEKFALDPKDFVACLDYIEKYWDKITCTYPHDKYTHFGLPNSFVSPNDGIYKNDQFYWDSYFTIVGLVKCNRVELAKGMIDNLLFMQKRFNIIPMRNRYYNLGSSQIPFLTSMAREVYSVTGDSRWFKTVMFAAENELKSYWMNKDLNELHIVFEGLSRYCDHYITHLAAEHESGWDMTSRFRNHCLNYLPIDLNCTLYKYEMDIAEFYKESGNVTKYHQYLSDAEMRGKRINSLMWNAKRGLYFDYDYKHKKRSTFLSLAGYYPLWARLATYPQAKKMRDNLKLFEYSGGLANSQSTGLAKEYRQHDYPNGWAPQHWIVIKGLMNYGFTEDAFRIAEKFLNLNLQIFQKTGKLWEKYNVVKMSVSDAERYVTQSGFAWTNAIFLRLVNKFSKQQ